MLSIAPTNHDCGGCGVTSGQPHADWCDIQWCAVFDTGSLSTDEEHDLTKANRRKSWLFRAGMGVEEMLREIAEGQDVRWFVVNLRAALDTCELADSPNSVRFASFEEAKKYVIENLEEVIGLISWTLDEVERANSVEELETEICCPDLITKDW